MPVVCVEEESNHAVALPLFDDDPSASPFSFVWSVYLTIPTTSLSLVAVSAPLPLPPPAQAKLLVILDFLARDRIITYNAQSLLKCLVLANDSSVLDLLPIIESAGTEAAFLDKVYSILDREAQKVMRNLFSSCSIETAKQASKSERADKNLTNERSLIYG